MVNHGLGAKLATDLLLLRSLVRLFRTENSLLHCQPVLEPEALCFLNGNLLFCNLIEAFFSSLKLNFMHDGVVLCLSPLFASFKWRLWSLK